MLLYHLVTGPAASLGVYRGSPICGVMSWLTLEAGRSCSSLGSTTGLGHVTLSMPQFPHHIWSCPLYLELRREERMHTVPAVYPSSTEAEGGSDHVSPSFPQRPRGSEVRSPVTFPCVPCSCTSCLAQSKAIHKGLLNYIELKIPGLRG